MSDIYGLFDTSGRFLSSVSGPLELVVQPTARSMNATAVPGCYDETFLIEKGKAKRRAACSAKLQESKIVSIPQGSEIFISGKTYVPDENGEFSLPEESFGCEVVLSCWPSLGARFLVGRPDSYTTLRKAEYPSITDQLDAVYKMGQALREQGIDLPRETVAWLDSCESVKLKFKKPE